MAIEINDLIPDAVYWARRLGQDETEIVQVSTIFGIAPEFLTVARLGTDVHDDLREFEFLEIVRRDK